MSIKVLITGSSGVLGRAVYDRLSKQTELLTYGLVYSRNKYENRIACDLTCEKSTIDTLNLIKPDLIVHCAAERRPDQVNKDLNNATKLNVDSSKIIAKWCQENKCRMIFISTDYVFDGKSPPYKEEAPVSPLNTYGALKAEAEKVIMGLLHNIVILRLPVLYGNVEFVEETAVTILFAKVKDCTITAPMSNYERRYPTHCDDVAHTISNMIKYWMLEKNSLSGVYHYQAEEEFTKLEMAIKMAEVFSLPSDHIVAEKNPDGNEAMKRPYNSKLSCDKLKSSGLYHPPRPFSIGIEACLKPFAN